MSRWDMATRECTDRTITIRCPSEPPVLFSDTVTPNAARVLQRVLVALAKSDGSDQHDVDGVLVRVP